MADLKEQAAKQLANLLGSTGKSLDEYTEMVTASGLEKHGQIVKFFKTENGIGHGNANLLAATILTNLAGGPASDDALLDNLFSGAKAHLRPIHDEVLKQAKALGSDVEVVNQKTGVSLRRKRQFALIQAPSSKRVALGFKMSDMPGNDRLKEVSGMCSHSVDLTDASQVDADILMWLSEAYHQAG